MAWARHGHGMSSVNQTRPHCVNQMGKAHFKPLAARHGHGMLCVNRPLVLCKPHRDRAELSSRRNYCVIKFFIWHLQGMGKTKADSHIACRSRAAPLPWCAAKGLECVFPIWFTQCGRVWFTLAMPCHAHAAPMPCSDHAVLLKATAQHGRRETACELPVHVQLLPATTRSFTNFVIRSMPILTTIHTYDCKEW